MEDGKPAKKLGLDVEDFEICYHPIVQSGRNLSLKVALESDEKRLKPGVVLCSVGVKYKSLCSNVARTFIIGASKVLCSLLSKEH